MPTGKKPFRGANSLVTLEHVLHQKPVPPRAHNPNLPVELEGIIGKAMEKDRKQRYQNAADMRADLELLRKETESGVVKRPIGKTAKLRVASKSLAGTVSSAQTYFIKAMAALLLMM